MRKVLLMLGVAFLVVSVTKSGEAQTLPGDGNCWICGVGQLPNGDPDPQCFGAPAGAYECIIDYHSGGGGCSTLGTGCSTYLADASGWFDEVVGCSSLVAIAPA